MPATIGYFLGWHAAAFSAGAAAIHFAETSTHVEEYWVFGGFFFFVAWFQAATALAIVARPNRRLIILAAGVNFVVIAIWIWSRTAGLPIGPEAGEPETVGAADLVATVLEALLVISALALLNRTVGSRKASPAFAVLTTVLVWAGVVVMTALVFFTDGAAASH